MMDIPFAVTYKCRWFGPCEYGDGKKEEIAISFTGNIRAKRYDHNGPNNRWRLIERATGTVPVDDAKQLYRELNDLFKARKYVDGMLNDAEEVIIIDEPGVKLSLDGNLTDGLNYCHKLIEEFMDKVELNRVEVKH
ncbi:hypothetical protein [Butyrivibrio sp. MB2005]|uniref:hypothetical protein n=1 Tax=Butyrivibrio sp. MB2005 TaxID=1280678 RepID=UPI0003FD9ABE|nr:hypothetical protein [Butyrivibrio sp. MB2005]